MPEWVGTALDILVLIFLAAAIFFGWRLSVSLEVFRKTRKDLDRLMQDLSRNIEKAENSIGNLKSVARDATRDLRGTVNEARALSEELQLMTQSGDSLASRLERSTGRSTQKEDSPKSVRLEPKPEQRNVAPPPPSFLIRDPDYYDTGRDDREPAMVDEGDGGGFRTKAERDLYAAIQKSSKNRTGGF